MHVKIETLSLNDTDQSVLGAPTNSIDPTDKQVCDDVVLLWRQEPSSEDLDIKKLHAKIKQRNSSWSLSEKKLKTVLTNHSLYAIDDHELFTYFDQVVSTETPMLDRKAFQKIEVRSNEKGKALYSKCFIKQGELIFQETEPLTYIPPLEKLTLAQTGKSCSLCGNSLTQSSHFTIMHGLDCAACNAIWCSKQCKRVDAIHAYLKHPMSKNKTVNAKNWLKFEKFCQDNVWNAAYSVGIIFARILLDASDNDVIRQQFESLAQVSQRIRIKASDSTNVGGTFDASSGSNISDAEALWEAGYELFCQAFPQAEKDSRMDLERFLLYVGKFNINQVSGQIYNIYAHLNHSCEPNVRFELDPKMGIKVFARKNIVPGEELLTTYVNPLHGVNLRRRELRVNWGFSCYCARCKKELDQRKLEKTPSAPPVSPTDAVFTNSRRRKSSMKSSRPNLSEMLKNGQEFELEIPQDIGVGVRRKSVRFDEKVMAAVEE